MAEKPTSNVQQFQPPRDLGNDQNVENVLVITGVADAVTRLKPNQLVARIIPPASGANIVKLPPLHTWINKDVTIYQTVSAPGGGTKIELSEGATDAVGDNLTATGDVVILRNVQGEKVIVVLDVTT